MAIPVVLPSAARVALGVRVADGLDYRTQHWKLKNLHKKNRSPAVTENGKSLQVGLPVLGIINGIGLPEG